MSRADRLTAYDSQNAEAAAVVLADPEAFGGEDAGLVRWAALVAGRAAPKQEQGELFDVEVTHGDEKRRVLPGGIAGGWLPSAHTPRRSGFATVNPENGGSSLAILRAGGCLARHAYLEPPKDCKQRAFCI